MSEVNLMERGALVDVLGSSIDHGGHALNSVPKLLRKVLEEDAWRDFVTKLGEVVHHETFDSFVIDQPLSGLGASVDLVERMVADDPEAKRLMKKARKHQGRKAQLPSESKGSQYGESSAYAAEVLEREHPDLYKQVVDGILSAHAAMVAAGKRPRRVSVRTDDLTSAAASLRRALGPDRAAELGALLKEVS